MVRERNPKARHTPTVLAHQLPFPCRSAHFFAAILFTDDGHNAAPINRLRCVLCSLERAIVFPHAHKGGVHVKMLGRHLYMVLPPKQQYATNRPKPRVRLNSIVMPPMQSGRSRLTYIHILCITSRDLYLCFPLQKW